MTAGALLYQALGLFCAVFLLWLAMRLSRELKDKGAVNILLCLFMGAVCCMLALSAVSYLATRTIVFDWTLQGDPDMGKALRLYIFTALLYLLAIILAMPARDIFKKRLPARAMPLSAMFMVTLLALGNMISEWLNAAKSHL